MSSECDGRSPTAVGRRTRRTRARPVQRRAIDGREAARRPGAVTVFVGAGHPWNGMTSSQGPRRRSLSRWGGMERQTDRPCAPENVRARCTANARIASSTTASTREARRVAVRVHPTALRRGVERESVLQVIPAGVRVEKRPHRRPQRFAGAGIRQPGPEVHFDRKETGRTAFPQSDTGNLRLEDATG